MAIYSKYTQFMLIGLLCRWWKPPDRYTKIRKKAPQKAGTYTYTKSMWVPPIAAYIYERASFKRIVEFHICFN